MVEMKGRLIISIISSLLDEAIIVFLVLWLLPQIGIEIPIWGTILIVLGFAAFAFISYRIGTRTLTKKPFPLLTMVGKEGITCTPLNPDGFIRVEGELWSARTEGANLDIGVIVLVTAQKKLVLKVKPLTSGAAS